MQVTHTEDHITHAVIGGKAQIDMGITDSAEFFHILSSTMYSDQKLAVVRETVCNAWDAHIDAGITNHPIEIVANGTVIKIRDFGKGIHKDLMGPIYGTYGGSTKKNDGRSTGGFGLGCKSPFAYTDNFQVTSFHKGVRTIYNLSKSSAAVDGKPAIIPIASFPTTETGLEVVIHLLEANHLEIFKKLFKRIVWNGGMKATLNGEKLLTVKTYAAKEKFFITSNKLLEKFSDLAISYGNVIYPLDLNIQYETLYRQAVELKNNCVESRANNTLVLIAPPNSISVTPSRESLSMQTHTINTLIMLLKDFIEGANKKANDLEISIVKDSVKEAVRKKKFTELLNTQFELPNKPASLIATLNTDFVIYSFEHMAKLRFTKHYPGRKSYLDIKLRVSNLLREKHTTPGLGISFLAALRRNQEAYLPSLWATKHVVQPLLRKIRKIKGMSEDRLLLNNIDRYLYRKTEEPVKASTVGYRKLFTQIGLLQNTVILTFSRKIDRGFLKIKLDQLGKSFEVTTLVYVVPRSEARVSEAREFFKKQGYIIADMTFDIGGETTLPVKKPRSITKLESGIPRLDAAKDMSHTDFNKYWSTGITRITNPEFIMLCSNTDNYRKSDRFVDWTNSESKMIIKLFGSLGGVAKTIKQLDTYISKGAKKVDEYIIEKVCSYIEKSSYTMQKQAISIQNISITLPINCERFFNRLMSNQRALTELNLISSPTEEEYDYDFMWTVLKNKYPMNPRVHAIASLLCKTPPHPDLDELIKGLEKSKALRFISVDSLVSGLSSTDSQNRLDALEMLQLICQ